VSACACGLVAVSGAVRIETFEDRIRDFSESWNQLFGYLNFTGIDEYEERYRGIFEKKNQQTVVCVGCLREGGGWQISYYINKLLNQRLQNNVFLLTL